MTLANPLLIGNAQAFWGDSPDAAALLLEQQPDLHYITMDYLAEVSLSIMAIQRDKDPTAGYAKDFIDVVRSLIPFWKNGSAVKLVTNAGGLNPLACSEACHKLLVEAGCTKRIGIVNGDDVFHLLKSHSKETLFNHLESGEKLESILPDLVTANAYLGAEGIAEALKKGADIVITGRVADPSLTVGPCIAHFGWSPTAYDKIAAATIAGHLIECGTQASGGFSTNWLKMENRSSIGFPYVIMNTDGSFIITKPAQTGGEVTLETVKEQLLYEIGDPDNYLSPDATVSFLSLKLTEEGKDRIRVTAAKGRAPSAYYKVSATYRHGFKAEGMLVCIGHQAEKKARETGKVLLQKLTKANAAPREFLVECIGAGDIVPGTLQPSDVTECVLRVAVHDEAQSKVERFTKELAPLITSGPQGLTGYSSGRPKVRPVFGYWPCLIAKELLQVKVTLI